MTDEERIMEAEDAVANAVTNYQLARTMLILAREARDRFKPSAAWLIADVHVRAWEIELGDAKDALIDAKERLANLRAEIAGNARRTDLAAQVMAALGEKG